MDKRHSSSFSSQKKPRPSTYRNRSNSFPVSDALGCSTPEAELILAEGRAAVRRRLGTHHRGRPRRDGIETFRPADHIGHLLQGTEDPQPPPSPPSNASRHSRVSSTATDRSTSTIIAPVQLPVDESPTNLTLDTSMLGDYSAQLAKFIQSQLKSIPTYNAMATLSPRSCPDLSFSRSPPRSPTKLVPVRRHVGAPNSIQIPGVFPPAKSAFSAWSSTDDDTDDESPFLPDTEDSDMAQTTEASPQPMMPYCGQPNHSTFLFSSTPIHEDIEPDTAKALFFPKSFDLARSSAEHASDDRSEDYLPSGLSSFSLLTSSLAPSFSSVSTGSYFDYKRSVSHAASSKDGLNAAVTPPFGKVISAISPFEEASLADVHDILVHSRQRVCVDGMAFDMVQDLSMPQEGPRHISTPC